MNYTDIFKRSKCDFSKLERYGFILEEAHYKLTEFLIDNLLLELVIYKTGVISLKVIDLAFNEEYTNYKIESQNGEYVNRVRDEIERVLKDVKEHCFIDNYFIYPQSNRITKLIKEKYSDDPQFLWKKKDSGAVFKNPYNDKWYGIIMNVNREKLGDTSKDVEVLNVKLDKDEINKLVKEKGFYRAYHMNKTYWISITLDETVKDDKIMELIRESHKYTEVTNNYILPANPSYFDIEDYFEKTSEVAWDEIKNIKKDDYVYLYVTKPYQSIMYKLKVTAVGNNEMILYLEKKYPKGMYNLETIKKYGLKTIRCARSMPVDLYNFIENK